MHRREIRSCSRLLNPGKKRTNMKIRGALMILLQRREKNSSKSLKNQIRGSRISINNILNWSRNCCREMKKYRYWKRKLSRPNRSMSSQKNSKTSKNLKIWLLKKRAKLYRCARWLKSVVSKSQRIRKEKISSRFRSSGYALINLIESLRPVCFVRASWKSSWN